MTMHVRGRLIDLDIDMSGKFQPGELDIGRVAAVESDGMHNPLFVLQPSSRNYICLDYPVVAAPQRKFDRPDLVPHGSTILLRAKRLPWPNTDCARYFRVGALLTIVEGKYIGRIVLRTYFGYIDLATGGMSEITGYTGVTEVAEAVMPL